MLQAAWTAQSLLTWLTTSSMATSEWHPLDSLKILAQLPCISSDTTLRKTPLVCLPMDGLMLWCQKKLFCRAHSRLCEYLIFLCLCPLSVTYTRWMLFTCQLFYPFYYYHHFYLCCGSMGLHHTCVLASQPRDWL